MFDAINTVKLIARWRTCNCIIANVQLHIGDRAMNAARCVELRSVPENLLCLWSSPYAPLCS